MRACSHNRIGLQDRGVEGRFDTIWKPRCVMEQLVDGVCAWIRSALVSTQTPLYTNGVYAPADRPVSCMSSGLPTSMHQYHPHEPAIELCTSKCLDVLPDPHHRKPLVLKPEIPIHLWLVAREEPKRRKSVANSDPDLLALGRSVLRLRAQPMGGTELQVPDHQRRSRPFISARVCLARQWNSGVDPYPPWM